jgi:hypothetical protein
MQCNVGQTEKTIRIIAGIAILAAGAVFQSWWGLIGIVPLATGIVRYCPAWQLLGVNTNAR